MIKFICFVVICFAQGIYAAPAPARGPGAFQLEVKKWSQSRKGSTAQRLNRFYQLYWEYLMTTYPEWATYQGYPGQNDRWSDFSPTGIQQQKEDIQAALKAIRGVSDAGLKGEDLLNYQLLKFRLEEDVASQKFPSEYLIMDQMNGIHGQLSDLLTIAPKRTAKDYDDMLARLRTAPTTIAQTLELLKQGLSKKVTPPKVTLLGLPSQFDKLLTEKVTDSPIYEPFKTIRPEVLSAEQAVRLQTEAAALILEKVYPSLKTLRDFLVSTYIPQSRQGIGWSELPDGQNWYNSRIKFHTTTDMTADQIFNLGTREVQRIRLEMDKVREQLKFRGDFKAFNQSLKDPRFYFTTSTELLDRFRTIGKKIDPELPKFFGRLPQLTYGVIEMPAYKAPNSPAAYYEGGSLIAGRPGNFVANTYDLKARPKWAMMDLTCHEAVPGHHLQISLAQEIDHLPEFRKNMDYTAFVEGWGLYAETLCDDMGLMTDPYEKYGQLTAEMWRAVRLVVDTGLHSKGWSREQAITYFRDAGPFAEQEIQAETNRYIVWAGQALAYKIGQLKFKELRDRSKEALKAKFDIRVFHDQVLSSGALPLQVLDKKIDTWIKTVGSEKH